ncbi:sigma-54-dependent transcriptional regulator [Janthinobacterium sp. HLX7-2]|uniref:sigma-54-dependent transcriptional regulator n=1 Tax=Janthinobacterium sp. HLX7-2 TaxID=1259331 RepID=UPI003F232C65
MNDADDTLTSPLAPATSIAASLLGLTILWHPDATRIGQQHIGPPGVGLIELNRFLPLFRRPGADGRALEHRCIARDPLRIARDDADGVTIATPGSRMAVEVNGAAAHGMLAFTAEQVARGIVLGLGGSVLVCVHWMRRLPKANELPGMLGVGDAAIAARDQVRQAALRDMPVLLLGETGTGKDVAARAIHAAGARAGRPFVAVNMATLGEALAAADLFGAVKGAYTGAESARSGLFADAADGTLFLDEIGDTPAAVQPMLLRVLESGDYRPLGGRQDLRSRARLISATDQDLGTRVFSAALLRRMEGFVIRLPALRERREDIGVLVRHFLAGCALEGEAEVLLPVAFVSALCNDDWPGNVRQLAHVVRRAALAVRAGETPLLVQFLRVERGAPALPAPAGVAAAKPRRTVVSEVGDAAVLAAMDNNGWRIRGAAVELGISRPSLYKLLEAHPWIRRPEAIRDEELRRVLAQHGGELGKCAAALRTPGEALRRHLRASGLLD